MKNHQLWFFTGLSILLLGSLTILVLLYSTTAIWQPVQAASTATAEPQSEQFTMDPESDRLSEAARRSLAEKQGMTERMAAEQTDAVQKPREEKVAPQLPAAVIENQTPPVPEGIFEGSEGLVRPSTASIENGWQGERNGVLLQVFAGALPDNPAQGIVMVVKVPPDQMKRETTWVLAPVESGSLRITEARDNLLMLSATDGSLWSFDLNTFTLEEAK